MSNTNHIIFQSTKYGETRNKLLSNFNDPNNDPNILCLSQSNEKTIHSIYLFLKSVIYSKCQC